MWSYSRIFSCRPTSLIYIWSPFFAYVSSSKQQRHIIMWTFVYSIWILVYLPNYTVVAARSGAGVGHQQRLPKKICENNTSFRRSILHWYLNRVWSRVGASIVHRVARSISFSVFLCYHEWLLVSLNIIEKQTWIISIGCKTHFR